MKKIITLALILFFTNVNGVSAQVAKKAPMSMPPEELPVAKTWAESKKALEKIKKIFEDKKLSKQEKVKQLPNSNMLLSDTQDLKLKDSEKKEQIDVIVSFIAASIETDFANSNTDTVYNHYKANRQLYVQEIKKISDKKIQEEIVEAFDGWEERDKAEDHSEGADD